MENNNTPTIGWRRYYAVNFALIEIEEHLFGRDIAILVEYTYTRESGYKEEGIQTTVNYSNWISKYLKDPVIKNKLAMAQRLADAYPYKGYKVKGLHA